jgi:propanol-preferring alcohol dehydrogenase
MLAARLRAIGQPLELVELPVPEPRGTELRIRVAACGVCRTDLHILFGSQPRVTPPLTLGHEVAGWIDAFGPDASRSLPLGEPVVVFGGWGCGSCRECRGGNEQRCALGASPGFQRDGGYAEFMLVPDARHLVRLGSLDPVRAAPLADAGVTPFRAVRRALAWLTPGARVLLIGFGALGQFAIQYLPPGCVVAVRDLDPRKVERARSMGAIPALDGPADVVFDFVGTSETLASAAVAVAPGGLISLVGEGAGTLPFSFDSPAVEASVTTTAWGSLDDLRSVVDAAAQLRWEVETMPLSQAAAALDRLAAGDVSGRLVLVPGVELSRPGGETGSPSDAGA